jgi:phage terminase small subunit
VKASNGSTSISNPFIRLQRQADEALQAAAVELGFSPTSRARMGKVFATGSGPGSDPWEESSA